MTRNMLFVLSEFRIADRNSSALEDQIFRRCWEIWLSYRWLEICKLKENKYLTFLSLFLAPSAVYLFIAHFMEHKKYNEKNEEKIHFSRKFVDNVGSYQGKKSEQNVVSMLAKRKDLIFVFGLVSRNSR